MATKLLLMLLVSLFDSCKPYKTEDYSNPDHFQFRRRQHSPENFLELVVFNSKFSMEQSQSRIAPFCKIGPKETADK